MTSWPWFCKGFTHMLRLKQSSDPVERIICVVKTKQKCFADVRPWFLFYRLETALRAYLGFISATKFLLSSGRLEPGSLKMLHNLLMATKRILNISLGYASAGGKGDSAITKNPFQQCPYLPAMRSNHRTPYASTKTWQGTSKVDNRPFESRLSWRWGLHPEPLAQCRNPFARLR